MLQLLSIINVFSIQRLILKIYHSIYGHQLASISYAYLIQYYMKICEKTHWAIFSNIEKSKYLKAFYIHYSLFTVYEFFTEF